MRATLACLLYVIAGASHLRADGPVSPQSAVDRASERLKVLRREADELATREKSLIVDLRKLELERQIRVADLVVLDAQFGELETQRADAREKTGALAHRVESQRPEVAARLVRLYKMGRIGCWRLLLDGDDLRAIGRTYRTAAAMLTRADVDRAGTCVPRDLGLPGSTSGARERTG